jgi:FkbM family methyltransferase
VISIEPDAENFAMLQKNVAPYRDRCTVIQGAVWPRAENLIFNQSFASAGQEWARAVEKATTNAPSFNKTVDIPSLIGTNRVSILKIDIEGAERDLFSSATEWLDQVDNMVIELHGPDCRNAFFAAIDGRQFDISTCGELTVCRR